MLSACVCVCVCVCVCDGQLKKITLSYFNLKGFSALTIICLHNLSYLVRPVSLPLQV